MLKNKKRYLSLTLTVLLAISIGGNVKAAYSEPGSESDPIVSKSYIDKKINELRDYIDMKIKNSIEDNKNNNQDNSQNTDESKDGYIVLELKKGQKLICEANTELIVRSGQVEAIASDQGGLSDLTEGIDLSTGDRVMSNHLILIPRSDSRGVSVESNSTFIMIKGKYTVK